MCGQQREADISSQRAYIEMSGQGAEGETHGANPLPSYRPAECDKGLLQVGAEAYLISCCKLRNL